MSSDGDDGCYVESDGQRYRVMSLDDFRKFKDLALSQDANWTTHYSDSVLTVQSKPSDDKSTYLNIIRASRVMERVQPEVLYNQLHDAQYRETWDKNMLKGHNIVQLDSHNDIGYYAAKFPWPLANRDFCNMRSWMEFTNGEYIIMNHSVPHKSCPERKKFVRARSIMTGFFIQPHNGGRGTLLRYVTLSDPCGSIPHGIINFAMSKGAPMILDNCEKCTEKYPAYCQTAYPADYVFPRRTPKVDWNGVGAVTDEADGQHTRPPTPSQPPLQPPQQPQPQPQVQNTSLHEGAMDIDTNQAPSATETERPLDSANTPSPPSLVTSTPWAPDDADASALSRVPSVSSVVPPSLQPATFAATPATAGTGRSGSSTVAAWDTAKPDRDVLSTIPTAMASSGAVSALSTSGFLDTATTGLPSLAAPNQLNDTVTVQRFRGILEDCINVVDQTFLREEHVPSTREYILRLRYILYGVRETSIS